MRMTEKLLARSEEGAGLRERKRVAAMRRIQAEAMDLFEARGFEGVTVEEIAAAAEVSPSSVYRYFGTKEGIVLTDEYDAQVLGMLPGLLGEHDPHQAIRAAMQAIAREHFETDLEMTLRRTKLWLSEPLVADASHAVIDQWVRDGSRMLIEMRPGRYDSLTAAVTVSSIVWALVAAMRVWHAEGAEEDLMEMMARAIVTVRTPVSPA